MPKENYDCTSRSFRDVVRSNHDISSSFHDSIVYNFYQGSNPSPVSLSWAELEAKGLTKESCGEKLIRIAFDTANSESNDDIEIDVIDWQDVPVDDPNTEKLEVYFSDIYFNASRLHYGMSTVQFRKAKYNEGGHTIAIRFFGSLNWHHGNLTGMIPFEGKKWILP